MNMPLRCVLLTLLVAACWGGSPANAQPYQLYPLTPCRLVDTRNPIPDGGALFHNVTRHFQVTTRCGIPTTAKAAALNMIVLNPTDAGHLVMWPYGTTPPPTSNINYWSGLAALANGTVMPLTAGSVNISVGAYFNGGAGHLLHFVLDVTGYFDQ